MRRSLSHAFSAKSLRLQQDLILHYVELFVQQLTRLGNQGNGLEMDEWYNWLTFDILGDLAFGEPFGAVADGSISLEAKFLANTFQLSQTSGLELFVKVLMPGRSILS